MFSELLADAVVGERERAYASTRWEREWRAVRVTTVKETGNDELRRPSPETPIAAGR